MSITWVTTILAAVALGLTGAAEPGGGENETAWGTPVKGLQAGLAFEERKTSVRVGESIAFVLRIRNVSEQRINLDYPGPSLKAWVPDLRDSGGGTMPAMPPVEARGGRVPHASLAPGKTLTLDRVALTIRPLGWEGQITQTVAFTEPGRYKVGCTSNRTMLTFGPHGECPWEGCLTTGQLDLEVMPAKTALKTESHGTSASKEEVQTVLRLLGDYERDLLEYVALDWGGEGRWRKRDAWQARCAALPPGAIDYLGYFATGNPDDGYRVVACHALGGTKQAGAAQALVKCLSDESGSVRRTAARSLGHQGLETNVPPLLKVLLSDADAGVRTGAAYALGHIGSDQATQGLVQALRSDSSADVKQAVTLALGWITDPAALPALKETLSGGDTSLHHYLRAAIRNIEDPDYWGLGVKRGVSEHDTYRLLLSKLDLAAARVATEKKDVPDLFEERSAGSGSYRLRSGVAKAVDGPYARVYHVPSKNVFYIWQYAQGGEPERYYGPFEGDAKKFVRQAIKELGRD